MTRPAGVPCLRPGADDAVVVSVPRTVVELLEHDPARRAAAGSAFRQLGATLEADVGALDLVVPGLGTRCVDYLLAARDLWACREAGDPVEGAVLVRVPLVDRRQTDSKVARVDLGPLHAAMEHIPALVPALGLLDADPDWSTLAGVGTLERHDDRSTLTVELASAHWPLELGGPAAPGEVSRTVRLEASHAAWRDRRVRRLVRVVVHAREIWPDPNLFPANRAE
jgi:hypothetical protein